jgi:hypothetical protein
VLGHGDGIYVPVVMLDLNIAYRPKQAARYLGLWDGLKPDMSEEMGHTTSCTIKKVHYPSLIDQIGPKPDCMTPSFEVQTHGTI